MNLAPHSLKLTIDRIITASLEIPIDAPRERWDEVHDLGCNCCFPLERVDIPWVRHAAKSVYHIHSSEKDNYATAFCLQENVFVTCDHVIRYDPVYHRDGGLQKFLQTFEVYQDRGRKPFQQPEGFPLPRSEPKLDFVVIKTNTKGASLNPEYSRRRGRQVCLAIGYPEWLRRNNTLGGPYVYFGVVQVTFDIAKPEWYFGEEGCSGSPMFDLEGKLLGVYAGDCACARAKNFKRYL